MSQVEMVETESLVTGSRVKNRYDQLLAAVEASKIGVWEWNAVTGETSFNDMWYRMLGLDPGELPEHVDSWVDLVHPDDRERTFADLEAYLKGRTDGYLNVHRLRHKDGHWVWIRDCGLTTLETDEGEPHILIGTHVDISELKETETRLIEAVERAEASERAKNRFLANMSHELRTPLTGILGLGELLLDSELDATDRRYVETLHSSAQALHRLLTDLLEITVLESGPTAFLSEPFCWQSLMEELVHLYARTAEEKRIDLRFEKTEPVETWTVGDRNRVRQVLSNLLSNALKFSPSDSTVVASLATQVLPSGELQISALVADEGPGVPEGEVEAIFERFHQLRPPGAVNQGGTGLGLAIVRTIAHGMGGQVRIARTGPDGSIFEFEVVLPRADASQVANRPTPEALVWSRPPRILVTDDVPALRELLAAHLRILGCDCVLVEDGEGALGALENDDSIDLVLMDCEMPHVDGYEATEILRARGSEVPVVGLSAHALPDHFARCSEVGMTGHLVKPFRRRDLSDMLQRYLPHLGEA